MKNKTDFISVLVGHSPGLLFGFIVIATICALVLVIADINKRDPASPRTPEDFHLRFWLADNLFRVIANMLFIPIAIRACYEYAPPFWMLFISMGVGFGIDGLMLVAKQFGILTTNKFADKIKNLVTSK